jgi:hypothetical protein
MAARSIRPSESSLPSNLVRDGRTVTAMLRIYCEHLHRPPGGELCDACTVLADYALGRLARCPFGPEKTTCRVCPIHCYRPAERADMKTVMVFSGSRMLWRHPWLALRHLWLERQGPPPWPPHARRRTTA